MSWNLRTLMARWLQPPEVEPAIREDRSRVADLSADAFASLATHPVFREMWNYGPLHEELENVRSRMMIEKDPNEMFQLRAQLRGMLQVKTIVERAAQHEKEKPRRRAAWHSPFLPRALGG